MNIKIDFDPNQSPENFRQNMRVRANEIRRFKKERSFRRVERHVRQLNTLPGDTLVRLGQIARMGMTEVSAGQSDLYEGNMQQLLLRNHVQVATSLQQSDPHITPIFNLLHRLYSLRTKALSSVSKPNLYNEVQCAINDIGIAIKKVCNLK